MANALVFAGQGAQFVGMGKELADRYPDCRALFDKANDVLGYDLAAICFEGPEEELMKTSRCQPAIFVVSAACYAALHSEMPELDYLAVAGLSLGEWTALHVAGVLSFEETLRVLAARGRLMQEACERTEGAMCSVIGLDRRRVDEICAEAGVSVSNVNSPGQIVLSGPAGAVSRAADLAKSAGAKRAVMLRVAGAYHSALMQAAAEGLERELSGVRFAEPRCPVLANVTGQPHGSPDAIRRDMVRQVTSPVQWLKSIEWFRAKGVGDYLECGPGRVLSGLIKRVDKEARLYNIQDLSSLESTLDGLRAAG